MAPLINFLELENRGEPGEEFEQLMRALFEAQGLQVTFSGRGPDQGRDLLVDEHLPGTISDLAKRTWLVSCKNYARSGKAVPESDLPSIENKCRQHGADGFLLVSTTTLSSNAQKMLDALRADPTFYFQVKYYVHDNVEQMILAEEQVFHRFFPESFRRYEAAKARSSITEPELQETFRDVWGQTLEPVVLRPLLIRTLQLGLTDVAQVRDILEDNEIRRTLEDIYQNLLERDLDPSGHFNWGYVLRQHGLTQGREIVQRQIIQSPEFVSKPNIAIELDIIAGPDYVVRFFEPGSGMRWQAYGAKTSQGRIERISQNGDRFVQLESQDEAGFRVRYPDNRYLGFQKAQCRLHWRFTGVAQIFFGCRDVDGRVRWLVYQTADTRSSDADRQNPDYAVRNLAAESGSKWDKVTFPLAAHYADSFGSDFQSVMKISFHVEGTLDIKSIVFTPPSDESVASQGND